MNPFFEELEKISSPKWIKMLQEKRLSLSKARGISRKLGLPTRQYKKIGQGAEASVHKGINQGDLVAVKNYLHMEPGMREIHRTIPTRESITQMKKMKGRILPRFIKKIKGKPIVIKEYVKGRTLKNLDEIGGTNTTRRVSEIVHRKTGIGLTDLERDNILITKDGKWKIIDWITTKDSNPDGWMEDLIKSLKHKMYK